MAQGKKKFKRYFALFSNIAQFMKLYHSFCKDNENLTQKILIPLQLVIKLPCTDVALYYFKTFRQQQLQTGLSNIYDGLRSSVKAQVIEVLSSYYFHNVQVKCCRAASQKTPSRFTPSESGAATFSLSVGSRRMRRQVKLSVQGVVYMLFLCKNTSTVQS